MQDSLFEESQEVPSALPIPPAPTAGPRHKGSKVAPAAPQAGLLELAAALPTTLRLGTSSWSYPGWVDTVWQREYPEARLSREGLPAYSRHPLFRTVSIDRSFYRALNVTQFATYAAQVPDDFRFVVKAPSVVTDALVRDEEGRGMRTNTFFLDATEAINSFVEPALQGLGPKLGALVFQISPLPLMLLPRMHELIARLHTLLRALPVLRERAPDAVIAVEVRDREWLSTQFVDALRDTGVTYCMGLNAKMPRIEEQLPILRKLWPGTLVCRWNLNPVHGIYGYESAGEQYAPFDKIIDPDPETRAALARVIAGVTGAGHNAFVTVSNQAEGSAPLSVMDLAKAVVALKR